MNDKKTFVFLKEDKKFCKYFEVSDGNIAKFTETWRKGIVSTKVQKSIADIWRLERKQI